MIKENVKSILANIPEGIKLVAATKERSLEEIEELSGTGVDTIGENYIQQARPKHCVLGDKFKWHLIGHLQKNKTKYAVKIFDMIETLDSIELAKVLDKECRKINKVMPVLIEINSACEPQKNGILPDDLEEFIKAAMVFENIKLKGLMTMGPLLEEAEKIRPYFKKVKNLFDGIRLKHGNELDWEYLSMGMSSSYRVAIEEGANIVRVGTAIFGKRSSQNK